MSIVYYISDEQDKLVFKPEYEELIKQAVDAALAFEHFSYPCEVSVTIVDNERIRELNNEFRNIDRETDVLSFPMEDEDDGMENVVLGDIVISLEKAEQQAKEYGHSLEREIAFLCVHSVLHLLGYDHMENEEERDMFERQEKILEKMGLTRG